MASPLVQKLHEALGSWGRPPDEPAQVVAGFAAVALLLALTGRGRSILGLGDNPLSRRTFFWASCFLAALLSIFYIAHYLQGGPRIVDATTYFLQGRALSHGDFAWPVAEPTASFRGRFLLYREEAGGAPGVGVMGGIFPPGYPLLLALAFGLGAPMLVGPVIAAALVIVTYRLTRTIAEHAVPRPLRARTPEATTGPANDPIEAVARTAALLSIVCGALRYHTADTMAHGATALGVALALTAALQRKAWLTGLFVGGVIATRPVSAIPVALVAIVWFVRDGRPGDTRALGKLALGALPGVLLLLVAQHAVTGAWLISSQRMYYASSDGPPGCWGIGRDAGCLYEHGEFVNARLKGGFGVLAATLTTLRRLRMHLLDVANLEPLALLVLVPFLKPRGVANRNPAAMAALAVIGLQILAYAPFYFDGNYPGGGARLFADVLPLEHALLALAIARLFSERGYVRGAFGLLSAALAGFAVHASFDHGKLETRDGGRPMFEPDVLARANVTNGLVFVDTDHGFSLGYDPSARVKTGVVVARLHNDDRDRMLYDRLDHPTTYLYKFDVPPNVTVAGSPAASAPPPQATPSLIPWTPAALGDSLRFEAEAEWPALSQSGGFAVPAFTEACASGSRALVLVPTPVDGRASATLTLPVTEAGRYAMTARIVRGAKLPFAKTRGGGVPHGTLSVGKERWQWVEGTGAPCADLPSHDVELSPPNVHLVVEAEGGGVALDKVTIRRLR